MAWYDKLLGRRPSDEEALSKAKGKAVPKPESWELDPHDYASHYNDEQSGGYHPGTMGLSFEQLRMMSRVPLISAVIQTRVNQVSEFAIPQATPYSLGFKLRMREHTKEPTKAAQKRIQELTRWLQTCGDPRLQVESSFESFLRRIIRDSLVFDQAAFDQGAERHARLGTLGRDDEIGIVPRRFGGGDTFFGNRGVCFVAFDADEMAAHFLGDRGGGAGPEKRIEDHVARFGRCQQDAVKQCFRFLRRVRLLAVLLDAFGAGA